MLSNHGAQIVRAVGASIRKFLGGSHHQIVNLPITSVMELRGHRMAIAARFAFQREISSSVLRDFFDSIDPTETSATLLESRSADYFSMCHDPSQSWDGGLALRLSTRLSNVIDGPSPGNASSAALRAQSASSHLC